MPDIPAEFAAAIGDRYTLERELGHGGMAIVFLAEDVKHRRHVAVKLLRAEIARALGPQRFLREIETVGRLRHPHILPLYDSGQAAGFLYYVMPLVEGESLRELLQRDKQLPKDEALAIAAEVLDALSYAHQQGVVHRDIKPENILLESGHAVIADFGIARAIDVASDERLTDTGVTLGTPLYMSPEQAAGGRELDGRSDLYSLGCVLYEMLVGEPPFTGPTAQSIVHQHVTAEPRSITDVRPAVSVEISAAVSRALAKTPADRWRTAAEFQARLRELGKSAAPRQAKPRWTVIAAAAVVIILVALGLWRFAAQPPATVSLGRRTQVTFAPGLEVHPALSPRGDLVAYTAGSSSQLIVRQVQGGNPIAVAAGLPGIQGWPHWSPDEAELSFASTRGLEVVPALGGTPRLLVSAPSSGSGGPGMVIAGPWSPDGREISFIHGDTLYAIPSAGGAARIIATEQGLHSCAWAPGRQRWLACVQGNSEAMMLGPVFGNIAPSGLVLVPAQGGPARRLLADGFGNSSPAWLPDGTLLFLSDREGGRDIYAVRLDGSGRTVAAPRRITTGLNALTITVAADGSRLAYDAFAEMSNVWSLAAPVGRAASIAQARQVTRGEQIIEQFDVAPDGRWLVFAASRGGPSHLYRAPLDQPGEAEQLTRDSIDEFSPAWSPNGRQIAFHSFRPDGRRQIFLMPAEGGATTELQTGSDDRDPVWTPDGQSVLTLTNYGRAEVQTAIMRRGHDGSWSAPVLWRRPPCAPLWSPDRRLVVCVEHTGRLLLTDLAGDAARVLVQRGPFPDMDVFPGWSSDGRTIYYIGPDSGATAIFAVSAQGGRPRIVVRFDDPTRPWHRYGFEVFRDRFYFTIGDRQSHVWLAEVTR
ncbi:MAG TPA: protein kinase [Gemmatimonadales bacterium]